MHNFSFLLLNFHHFFIAFRNIFVHFQKLKVSNCSTRLHSQKLSQTFGCFPLHPKTGSWLSLANAQEIFSILFSFFVSKNAFYEASNVSLGHLIESENRDQFLIVWSARVWFFSISWNLNFLIFCITKNGGKIQRSGQN